jgi:GNAT superfamily N-acetyltransferase
MAAHTEHSGAGFGAAIMRAAEHWLAMRGIWKVQLLERADNSSAGRFYERIGYADPGVRCFQKAIEPLKR